MPSDSYPRTIENGAGERLTFLRRVRGNLGDRLEVENVVSPGAGPPMHIHHFQEEGMTVREGRVGYQRAGEPAEFAGPGETLIFKAGEAHKFWNAGSGDLRVTGYIEPAANVEYFLTAMYESMQRRGGTRPDPFDAAFLTTRYRHEFTMTEIPSAVRRLVFPIQVIIGTLLGKYKRFADAPEPVRR